MKILVFYERHKYTAKELNEITEEKEELIKIGVIKIYNQNSPDINDLIDGGAATTENNSEIIYAFVYVGIVIVGGYVLYILPKYMEHKEPDECKKEQIDCIKQVVQVIEKYNRQQANQDISIGDSDSANMLPLMVALLRDYYENGLYFSKITVTEYDGDGEILWDNTIENIQPYMAKNGAPIYPNLITERNVSDEHNFFKLLHECILTECSEKFEDVGLSDVLGITPVCLTAHRLDDLGDKVFLLYRIQNEKKRVFNTRKLNLLAWFEQYINAQVSVGRDRDVDMFATHSFHVVWEKVCSDVFNNVFKKPIFKFIKGSSELGTFEDYIPKPSWSFNGNPFRDEKTLIPDIIAVEGTDFFVLDAKYYSVTIKNGSISGNLPGIGDIIKQIMYMSIYNKLLDSSSYNRHNIFLFPSGGKAESGEAAKFTKGLSVSFNNSTISAVLCNAEFMFEYYLKNKTCSPTVLKEKP